MRPTTSIAPAGDARSGHWIVPTYWVMSLGILAIVLMQVTSSRSIFGDALSSYAFGPVDSVLFAVSVLSLAACAALVPLSLRSAGIALGRWTVTLFGAWGGGLTLAVLFPAAYGAHPNLTSGTIHQYSCAVAFTTLPASLIGVVRRARRTGALALSRLQLERLLRIAVGCLALFGLSYLAEKLGTVGILDAISIVLPVAVTQRIVLAADIVALAAVVVMATRVLEERRQDDHEGRHEQQKRGPDNARESQPRAVATGVLEPPTTYVAGDVVVKPVDGARRRGPDPLERRHQRPALPGADRGVVGHHLDQERHAGLSAAYADRERQRRAPRHERQHHQIVPSTQMSPLMSEYGLDLLGGQ